MTEITPKYTPPSKKPNSFGLTFCEPIQFNDGTWVLDAKYNSADFYIMLGEDSDEPIFHKELGRILNEKEFKEKVKMDYVHFHIDAASEYENKPVWWLGFKGKKGAKKVLTFSL